MSDAANRKLKPVFPRKPDYRRNIISLHALHDGRGPPIDHGVPYLAGFLVTGIIRNYDASLDKTLDLFSRLQHQRCHDILLLVKFVTGMKACFQPLGVILPVNDWATILPSRTTSVSVPNSY